MTALTGSSINLIDTNVLIKAIPSMYDILTGRVRMSSILGTPLIQISHQLMPAWQENVKTAMDYIHRHTGPYHYFTADTFPDDRCQIILQRSDLLQS